MSIKKILLFIPLIYCCFISSLFAQKITLSGYIKDDKGEPLISANVIIKEINKRTTTNTDGFYKVELPNSGDYTIAFSSIGQKTLIKSSKFSKNTTIDVILEADSYVLKDVIISEVAKRNVRSTEVGVNRLSMKTIEKLPAFMGEVDLVKTIQMMPGVTTVGEGASGFNVRGGSIDHNLILLDGAPIYNSSHLFGFFSIFNPDAVKDVSLIKGGITSNYGGRLASVLDVSLKEGNSNRYAVSGGIGLIFSRLSFEGPLTDKGTFIIAARRSYIDALLKPLVSDLDAFNFTDLTLKSTYKFNDKNRLYISSYWGRDKIALIIGDSNDFGIKWGNIVGSIRWNKIFTDFLYSNLTATYSSYNFGFNISNSNSSFIWDSSIYNIGLIYDFNYTLDKQNIKWGVSSSFYEGHPSDASVALSTQSTDLTVPSQKALEHGIYLEDEYNINTDFSIKAGIRFSSYQLLGSFDAYKYQDNEGFRRTTVSSPTVYGNNKIVKSYFYPEPRFSARYSLSESSSIKMGYNRMVQYIHLISTGMASAPFDYYSFSTIDVKPEIADQVSLGYFSNYFNDIIETSVEVYYKAMQNQIDYVQGAKVLLQKNIETELLYGKGRAYGAEFFIKKNSGKLTGWTSYTLAKTERLVNFINNNDWFPSKYDRRHNFNITLMYQLTKKWSISSDWVYLSGTWMNMPTTRYVYQGMVIGDDYYSTRNQFQIPAYHRLDFSTTYEFDKSSNKRYSHSIVFTLYNIYFRRNAFIVYTQPKDADASQTEAVRLSIIGSIVPGITYNFKF